ncbi:MAG: glycosyl hydrolase family 28-related protein, partial [Pirellulales bacterium]
MALPERDAASEITFSLIGQPDYFHRHRLEVEGVPEHRQAIYQSNWTGDMGVRVEGLKDEPYVVQLDYVDLDLNAPEMRYFDILINDEVVKSGVNIFKEVGLRRVLSFEFPAEPRDGAIEYFHRKHVPEAIFSIFTVIRLLDSSGQLVAEKSAWDMRPPDWDLHGYLDKIYFGPIRKSPPDPPWEGTYKIRAHETEKLTAADVIGPDGIAYPNWTRVGIPGGIPDLETTISVAEFGAVADDDGDDSAALQEAIHRLEAEEGGGVLLIPDGLYYLDRPITISGDNIVLRGNGSDKTRLVSRFSMRGLDP